MSAKEEQDLRIFVNAVNSPLTLDSLHHLVEYGHKIELLNKRGEKIKDIRDDTFPLFRYKVTFNYNVRNNR